MTQNSGKSAEFSPSPEQRPLSPEAQRALAEAQARRVAREASEIAASEEVGGRGGLDPARYGDWEKDGIASDF